MPNVTPYTGLAMGNGFPFCLEGVDVSGFDYWSTLGGFNKDSGGSPTPEQISLSWQNAWRLYWMLYGVTATFVETGTSDEYTINADGDLVVGDALPTENLCLDENDQSGKILFSDSFPGSFESNFIAEPSPVSPFRSIVRLYNGTTDDESNFIGYGISSGLDVDSYRTSDNFGVYIGFFFSPEGLVAMTSYIDEVAPGSFEAIDYAYTTISGIHVVCLAYAFGDNPIADPANRRIYVEDTTATYELSIDSIEFYNQ